MAPEEKHDKVRRR